MKLLCLFFSLFTCTYINLQAQNSSVVQSTVESILLGKASALNSSIADNFELEIDGQVYSASNNPIIELQNFLTNFPCKSLQITNPGGNPARGDYRANEGSFWLILHITADNKLGRIVITKK